MSAKATSPFFRLLGTLTVFLGLSAFTQANVIFSNDFESVTAGTYSGGTAVTDGVSEPSTNGDPFGPDAALGNASGSNNLTVNSSGVNGSAGVTAGSDVVVRSRNPADMTVTTSFSFYFLYKANTNNDNGFIGAGWGRPGNGTFPQASGIDGQNPYNGGSANRIMVGLEKSGLNQGELAIGGQFNGLTSLSGEPGDIVSATFTHNTWYQMTFDLTFNHDSETPTASTFLIEDVSILNWGLDGITGGTEILSLASHSVNPSAGGNFDNDPTGGYAIFATNEDRGVSTLDNLSVVAIPEPGVDALGFFAVLLCLFRRRR